MEESRDIDIEKMRSIGIVGQPYGKPHYAPTEGEHFNSTKEFDDYCKENKLVPLEAKTKARNRRRYRFDEVLGKVVEI